jgi:hypothetical protein
MSGEKNLFKALVSFQTSVSKIIKDKDNPFHRSKYADLSTVVETVKPALNENGLVVVQPIILKKIVTEDFDGVQKGHSSSVMVLRTMLIHESGETLESEMIIPPQSDPQKLGSLITYYRRYSYLAIIGLSSQADDDDANGASNKQTGGQYDNKGNQNNKGNWSKESNNKESSKQESHNKESSQSSKGKISPNQVKALKAIYKESYKEEWDNISFEQASKLIQDGNNKK